MPISEQTFAAICYVVIATTNENLEQSSPGYILEKTVMLDEGYDAYGRLDRDNQRRVLRYLAKWKVAVPQKIKNYEDGLKMQG